MSGGLDVPASPGDLREQPAAAYLTGRRYAERLHLAAAHPAHQVQDLLLPGRVQQDRSEQCLLCLDDTAAQDARCCHSCPSYASEESLLTYLI